MKTERTELVFVLDKSGSMAGLEKDTIGGFNAMLNKQKEIKGECTITTILFDNRYEILHDRIPMKGIQAMTDREYQVGGSTALLDAIGRTIHKIVNVYRHTAKEYQGDKVMFVIITDGEENASREYSYEKVRGMIEHQKNQYGWEFLFLGANIDAVQTARDFGIAPDRAQNFHADKDGMAVNFKVMSEVVTNYRSEGVVTKDWNRDIDRDYKKRKK